MIDSYTAKLIQQLKSKALSANIPWTEERDDYYTFVDLGGVNLEITNNGSVELAIRSPSKQQKESLYIEYVHKPDSINSSIIQELFQDYLSGKLFELNRHRWWSSPELVVRKRSGDYFSVKEKKDIELDDRSTLTPILVNRISTAG